jgi:hypothetical protein
VKHQFSVNACVAVALLVVAAPVGAQTRFPMKYLGELGELRGSASIGAATVRSVPNQDLLGVEGRDSTGKRWRVWLPQISKMGHTSAWGSDFDANGHVDLLFAHSFSGLGFCPSWLQITIVLFDSTGRPSASTLSNSPPPSKRYFGIPVIVRDLNGDGRAEFVVTECAAQRFSLSGLYEAREAHLEPLRRANVQTYGKLTSRVYGVKRLHVLPAGRWRDPAAKEVIECDDPRCDPWPVTLVETAEDRQIFVANTRATVTNSSRRPQ